MDNYWRVGSLFISLYITIIEKKIHCQSHKKDNLKSLIVPCDLLHKVLMKANKEKEGQLTSVPWSINRPLHSTWKSVWELVSCLSIFLKKIYNHLSICRIQEVINIFFCALEVLMKDTNICGYLLLLEPFYRSLLLFLWFIIIIFMICIKTLNIKKLR